MSCFYNLTVRGNIKPQSTCLWCHWLQHTSSCCILKAFMWINIGLMRDTISVCELVSSFHNVWSVWSHHAEGITAISPPSVTHTCITCHCVCMYVRVSVHACMWQRGTEMERRIRGKASKKWVWMDKTDGEMKICQMVRSQSAEMKWSVAEHWMFTFTQSLFLFVSRSIVCQVTEGL